MFQKGDWVCIKREFWNIEPTYTLGVNEIMRKYAGKEYQIRLVNYGDVRTRYKLYDDVHDWIWDENWLEPVPEYKDVSSEELDVLFKEY